MGSLSATQYSLLLVAVAVAGATSGLSAASIARRSRRHRRRVFRAGFFCGAMATVIARRRWHDAMRLAVLPFAAPLGRSPRWRPRQFRLSLRGHGR
jgi:hypothetical protein